MVIRYLGGAEAIACQSCRHEIATLQVMFDDKEVFLVCYRCRP